MRILLKQSRSGDTVASEAKRHALVLSALKGGPQAKGQNIRAIRESVMKKLPLPFVATVILGLFSTTVTSAADCRINLALSSNGAVASQRDDPFGLPPRYGNDGNIVANTTFAHTGNADNEWWEVNLGAAHPIREVRVWLRSDSASFTSRDANLRLVVYDNASHTTELYSQFLDGSAIPLPYRNIDVV